MKYLLYGQALIVFAHFTFAGGGLLDSLGVMLFGLAGLYVETHPLTRDGSRSIRSSRDDGPEVF